MIEALMKQYSYKVLSQRNSYGQISVPTAASGYIKMNIQMLNQSNTNDLLYSDATFIGLTQDYVDDTYIIINGSKELKVLYVNDAGRYKQVWLKEFK